MSLHETPLRDSGGPREDRFHRNDPISRHDRDVLARDDPPASPVRPWAPPALPRYEGELRQFQPTEAERRYLPAIDPRKIYNLAELIDIAQRSNPETRVAWERARMAAAAVGLTESAYYPYIVGAAAGGYDRAFIPFPQLRADLTKPPTNGNLPNVDIVGGGTLITESLLARAELNAKWLLIDFGERGAIRAAAREKIDDGECRLTGTHQKIVFDVTDRFYQLGTARQKVMVTQSALDAAKTVEEAAQARFDTDLPRNPNCSRRNSRARNRISIFRPASVRRAMPE